jgi:putative ABC transport system substrate-binding protein
MVWPLATRAQQRGTARVGWLTIARNPQIDSFRAGMRDLGYIEGRNLTIEQRDAEGDPVRLVALASDLARGKVDVVVAIGGAAARAIREVYSPAPIVYLTNNSVGQKLVDSLARPGGNLTGLELMSPDISTKWLELIGELLPYASRFVVLEFEASANDAQAQPLLSASRATGKEVVISSVLDVADLSRTFENASRAGAQGMIILSNATFHAHRKRITDLAAQFRLPAIYEHRDFVVAGGLMSYGPDLNVVFRRLASYVDRILKGTRPADLPVELPTRFELVVNLKAAKALGLTIPPALLARADEMIE